MMVAAMDKRALAFAAALLLAPLGAAAEMYKCKRADGKTSFQDAPCEPGAKGEAVVITDPSPAYDPKAKPPSLNAGKKLPESRTPIADETLRQRNRQLEAQNRSMACSQARRNVEVLKRERPVYSFDKNGNKVYVEDADRAAELADAQKRVAEFCG